MSFTEAIGNATKAVICANLNAGAAANSYFNSLSPIDLPNFSKYWQGQICNGNPQNVPSNQPPFQGGQCDAPYRVSFLGTSSNGEPFTTDTSGQGPVKSIEFTQPKQEEGGSRWFFDYRVEYADGVKEFQGNQVQAGSAVTREGPIRLDGQADNCGDPPITFPPWPAGGNTYNINVSYVDNSSNNVSLSGTFVLFAPVVAPVFAPVFAPVTTVIAPIRFDLGGVQFNGTVQFAPTFQVNLGTPLGDQSPGHTEDPGQPVPTTDPTTPEDSENNRLIGVQVSVTQIGQTSATELSQDAAPTLFVPRLGTLYFRTRHDGVLGWAKGVDIQLTRQYVPVPANANAIAWTLYTTKNVSANAVGVYSTAPT